MARKFVATACERAIQSKLSLFGFVDIRSNFGDSCQPTWMARTPAGHDTLILLVIG